MLERVFVSFMFIWQDFINFKWHDEHHLILHEKKYLYQNAASFAMVCKHSGLFSA